MTSRKQKWLLALVAVGLAAFVTVFLAGRRMAQRFEPYIKEQAVLYLEKRFDSKVEVAHFSVDLPKFSPARLFFSRGLGVIARVEGDGVLLRHQGRVDIPPLIAMKSFRFEVDVGRIFEPTKHVALIHIDGMDIRVPPKGDRPAFPGAAPDKPPPDVIIADVLIHDAKLVLLPKRADRKPLEFQLHDIHLKSAGFNRAMNYTARLTNPRPPGKIQSQGSFGPWNAGTPSDTPLAGEYVFTEADLGVFPAIGGTLRSTGQFEGKLSAINAKGQASVPDFRLRRSGNKIPLETTFEAFIDGTNGNTTLKPIHAVLGSTRFTTSGAVIKHDGDPRRTIDLAFTMPAGHLADIMKLAMPGPPMMEGRLNMSATISVPPLSGKVIERLVLDGKFQIHAGQFLKSKIQDKLDTLSRRGQGQPKNQEIDAVVSGMGGAFRLDDQVITFRDLHFSVPGAAVALAGNYDLGTDKLDFHGALRLDAKVSQTMSGWKRIALKPVDPFLAKEGAGTFLRIQVTGSSKDPEFGRDRRSTKDLPGPKK